jgi:hypothetical protein
MMQSIAAGAIPCSKHPDNLFREGVRIRGLCAKLRPCPIENVFYRRNPGGHYGTSASQGLDHDQPEPVAIATSGFDEWRNQGGGVLV